MRDHTTEGAIGAPRIPRQPIRPYTCGGCDNTWTGSSQAHCSACHRTFSGVSRFDEHRQRGACVDPATMHTKDGRPRMRLEAGIWHNAERDPREWPR